MGDHKDAFRYKAFISYSWADAKWGKWLQHAIETYRTPRALVGEDKGHGPVPARLHPLFKDREEEAAGASIGAAVEAALADSEFLIVICSPHSAKSQWVNRELAWFKTHRDPSKVLALIVGGEPGDPANECFPKALTHHIADDLTVTDIHEDAPLAADARDSGDGKRIAKLKLAAAMLGVGLDELVRRDDRRRALRTRALVAASLTLAAVMSTLTWFAVEARKEADRQRAEAEGLIEFMLTDLREKLEPVGRLDALDVVGKRALTYYAGQNPGSLDANSLGRRARALLLVGEITNIRGDSGAALKAFTQAAATTREQLARDPDNEQRIFDHAQSVFWVGAIAYGRGELKNAEAQFREYKRLADRLIERNPDKPEWLMESSFAETNLGVILREQGLYDAAEPALTNALARIAAVSASEPYDAGREIERGTIANWLGVTKKALGKTAEAQNLHRREIALYEAVLARDPNNTQAKNRLSIGFQYLGGLELDQGRIKEAIRSYERSLGLTGELRRLEPANTEWQETEVGGLQSLAQIHYFAGRFGESRSMLDQASRLLASMVAQDPENTSWGELLRMDEFVLRTRLAIAEDNMPEAQRHLDDALTIASQLTGRATDAGKARTLMLAGDLQLRNRNREAAIKHWQAAAGAISDFAGADDMRFMLAKRLGDREAEARLRAALDRRGYRHPAYLRER